MQGTGFDNEKYLGEQTKAILERVDKFDHKLYLEFGGKLCFDYHAARVLPGYDPNVKMKLLEGLKEKMEIIFCVSAKDIEKGRMRGDFGITYDVSTLKTIDDIRDWGLEILAVVINRFGSEIQAIQLKNKLERKGIKVYTQREIQGYPADVDMIVSGEGYGGNPYIKTSKPIVVVIGAGPGSGKMATCLSQMYHDHKCGIFSGFAKFETFPIWHLPLDHPVNLAYEAATADLGDKVMVDPFHLTAYNITAVNYNRDIENFPILKNILDRIIHDGRVKITYNSPTDMGVNSAGHGIIDDNVVRDAAKQEIIRRYFRYNWEYTLGIEKKETVQRVELLMQKLGLKLEDRKTVVPARDAAQEAEKKGKGDKGLFCGAAIELPSGEIITGKNSPLLHSASAAILNAIKCLANIPDKIHLLPTGVISNIAQLKKDVLEMKSESLDAQEILIALSISAAANPAAEEAVKMLKELEGCEMHLTHVPTAGDEAGLRNLGIIVTTDANLTSQRYFLRYR